MCSSPGGFADLDRALERGLLRHPRRRNREASNRSSPSSAGTDRATAAAEFAELTPSLAPRPLPNGRPCDTFRRGLESGVSVRTAPANLLMTSTASNPSDDYEFDVHPTAATPTTAGSTPITPSRSGDYQGRRGGCASVSSASSTRIVSSPAMGFGDTRPSRYGDRVLRARAACSSTRTAWATVRRCGPARCSLCRQAPVSRTASSTRPQ